MEIGNAIGTDSIQPINAVSASFPELAERSENQLENGSFSLVLSEFSPPQTTSFTGNIAPTVLPASQNDALPQAKATPGKSLPIGEVLPDVALPVPSTPRDTPQRLLPREEIALPTPSEPQLGEAGVEVQSANPVRAAAVQRIVALQQVSQMPGIGAVPVAAQVPVGGVPETEGVSAAPAESLKITYQLPQTGERRVIDQLLGASNAGDPDVAPKLAEADRARIAGPAAVDKDPLLAAKPNESVTQAPRGEAISSTPPSTPTAPISPTTPSSFSTGAALHSLGLSSDLNAPLETMIDNLAQAKASGRIARGEVSLRHPDFGAVAVQVEKLDADLKAQLSSRDPGFAPAAQAALAERAIAAVSDTQAASQQRGQDTAQQHSHSRDLAQSGQSGEQGRSASQGNDPDRKQAQQASLSSRNAAQEALQNTSQTTRRSGERFA